MIALMLLKLLVLFGTEVLAADSRQPSHHRPMTLDKGVIVILHKPAACQKVMKLVKNSSFVVDCHKKALPRSHASMVRRDDPELSRVYHMKYFGSAFVKDFQRIKKIPDFAVTEIDG